jgi:hypothetical protein
MLPWRELDDLLRGRRTSPEALGEGAAGLRLTALVPMAVVLAAFYGLAMALYAVLTREPPVPAQLAASAVKLPLLFLLTLLVTFPSLYVFSALAGARYSAAAALRLVVAAMTVNLAVLASFAPITAFFTLTTTSYPFMKLLSVFFLGVAGIIGLVFLVGAMRNLNAACAAAEGDGQADAPSPASGAPDRQPAPGDAPGMGIFKLWMLVYALVGVQMGWILRPFIGDPDDRFVWFCERGGNAFADILHALRDLIGTP